MQVDKGPSLVERLESNVRGYCRQFPVVFESAAGSLMTTASGERFIDFFCGAGSLNYGHNNPRVKKALVEYIQRDGIMHSLDMMTGSKLEFMSAFEQTILKPRDLKYRLQFTGPTGTNVVEAALKLARKSTGRRHVVAFTRGYHGHTAGALALTANQAFQDESYGGREHVTHLPFDGYLGPEADTSLILEKYLSDPSSGMPKPAAVVLETIQGEGGVNVASNQWLRRIAELCESFDIRLIIDDIQAGNGRSGDFFSFEQAGITPDLVCLSKSIGGGLPLSVLLLRDDIDVWNPGQHTGTFRGNNLAFVAGKAVLEHWNDSEFMDGIAMRSLRLQNWLSNLAAAYPGAFSYRGRGMIWGIDLREESLSARVRELAFERGLLIEASGPYDEVVKLMPALTMPLEQLEKGLSILSDAIGETLATESQSTSSAASPAATASVVPPLTNSQPWSISTQTPRGTDA